MRLKRMVERVDIDYLIPNNPIWVDALVSELTKPYYKELRNFLFEELNSGKTVLPMGANIFRAYEATPLFAVKVVIIGQDPYPQAGVGNGLAFSTHQTMLKTPPSLANIFKAIKVDLGFENTYPDLTYWAHQGVFLLNRILTVREGEPLSHAGKGWEQWTEATVRAILQQGSPTVFMLWGSKAQELEPLILEEGKPGAYLILNSAHPSPLSAHRGFLWCKHFSQANEWLKKHRGVDIDWRL